jgi:spore photoproduct lyase
MIPYRPKLILVQDQSWQDSATKEILQRLPGIEIRTITDKNIGACGSDTLVLMRYPGKFLRQCQGAGAEICCNYHVVSYAWNCHLECSYCVLQSYLNSEAIVLCTNFADLLNDVKSALQKHPNRIFRIGTGELADSLALDHITHYSRSIVPFFASLPNGFLELKTKSDQIFNLEDLAHGGHTIVSWSMNSRRICLTEESKAAGFEERLSAARQCQKWGYRVGFHFDPIIYYDGWENEYRQAIEEILHAVDPKRIVWISLGALRFTPHLREIARKRFPNSRIPYGEFIPGHHGKLRYFRPIREEIYRKMNSWIHGEAPHVFVYLCMESRAVWERSFGKAPRNASDLDRQMNGLVGMESAPGADFIKPDSDAIFP